MVKDTGDGGTTPQAAGEIAVKGTRGGPGKGKPARKVSDQSLEKLFDRPPPHSLEAEMSLLGSLLLDPDIMGEVISLVHEPEQFYRQAHGAIFRAIRDTYDKHRSGDLVQITETLKNQDLLEPSGGPDYLVELASMVPSARNAVRYAKIVAEKSRMRRLIDAAGQILYDAYHAGSEEVGEPSTVLDAAQQSVFAIVGEGEASGPERLSKVLGEEFLKIEQNRHSGGVSGLPTGFDDLDEMLSGLQGGEMLILAARPSMGKTALALNLAEQVAFGGRTPWSPRAAYEPKAVGFFSLEMSKEALALRLISARSQVNAHNLRTGDLTDDDMRRVHEACEELYEAPVYIDDTPGLTIMAMRAKARRMRDQHGIEALFIDYLQLLTAPGAARESRQNEVATISRQIKALARELDMPVVCLAQLNRQAEQRDRNRPRMSDLRESGSIEQDADVVMLLHREAYFHKDDEEWLHDEENADKINLAELIVAKQRNGPTGVVKLTWDQSTTRFKNHDFRHAGGSGGYGGGASPTASQGEPAPSGPLATGGIGSGGLNAGWGDAGWAEQAPFDAGGGPGFGSSAGPSSGSEPPTAPPRVPFRPGGGTGPVDDHRDGGGPDRDAFDPGGPAPGLPRPDPSEDMLDDIGEEPESFHGTDDL